MAQQVEPESVDFLLAQVCKLHHGRARTLLEALGLYRGQPRVLHMLWEREGLTHGELAARLEVQASTITKMITRMVRTGFVRRQTDPQDQRVSRVYLTETGRSIQEGVERVWRRLEEETFAGLDPEERAQLHRLFTRMRDNLWRVTRGEQRQ